MQASKTDKTIVLLVLALHHGFGDDVCPLSCGELKNGWWELSVVQLTPTSWSFRTTMGSPQWQHLSMRMIQKRKKQLITSLLLFFYYCKDAALCFVFPRQRPHLRNGSDLSESLSTATSGTKEKSKAVNIDGFPYPVTVSKESDTWIQEAASHLQENGVCVLVASADDEHPLMIDSEDCQTTSDVALTLPFWV